MTIKSNSKTHLKGLKLLAVLTLAIFALTALPAQKASAILVSNGSNIPPAVKADAYAACIRTGNAIAEEQWLSLPGLPLSQSATVPPTTTAIKLQWNVARYYCLDGYDSNGALDNTLSTYFIVSSASPSNATNLVNRSQSVGYDHTNFWGQVAKTFSLTVPKSSGTITVSEDTQEVNTFNTTTPQRYDCVGAAQPPAPETVANGWDRSGPTDVSSPPPCYPYPAKMDFTINFSSSSKAWQLNGTTAVSGKQNSWTFNNNVKNSGPDTATYSWTVQSQYNSGGWSTLTSGSASNVAKGASNPSNKTNNYSFPTSAVTGDKYCERIRYTNATGPSTGAANSTEACVGFDVPVCTNGSPGPYPLCPLSPPTCTNGSPGPYPACPLPLGSNCPGDPAIMSSTLVNISLPYSGPILTTTHSSTSIQSSSSPAPAPYEQDTPQNVKVSGAPDGLIQDTSTGGIKHPPPEVSENDGTPGTSTSASGSITVDYRPFVTYYPYDKNSSSVTYDSYYQKIIWTPSFTGYSCNPGDALSGSTCTNTSTYTANNVYGCQAGTTSFGAYCYSYNNPYNSAAPYDSVCNPPGLTGGYNYLGTCQYAPIFLYSYCNYGDTGGGGQNATCTHTYTYPAYANYYWTAGSPSTEHTPNTVAGYAMNACFNRTFNLIPQNGTVPPITNLENPTTVSYNATVDSYFDGDHSTGGPITSSMRVPSYVNGIKTAINVSVYHENDLGVQTGPTSLSSCPAAAGPPPGVIVAPSTYNASSTTNNPGPPGLPDSVPVTISCAASIPPLHYGDRICFSLATDPSQGIMNLNGSILSTSVLLRTQPGGPPASATDAPSYCTNYFNAEPYLKVFGGDVTAGTDTLSAASCTNPFAPINAWNNISDYSGAGTQLAAFAAGTINGFSSAQNTGGSGPGPPTGLTFANNPLLGTYGGGFGASSNDCSTDYFKAGYSSTLPTFPMGAVALPPGSYAYQLPPGSTIGNPVTPLNIPLGTNVVVYVNGSVNIDGNITYGGVSSNLSQMPNFEVIANGGIIKIDKAVTKLNGDYVAEGGMINDCYNVAASSPVNPGYWFYDSTDPTNPALASTCGQKLTLDGSFTAQNLVLARTGHDSSGNPSTLYLASPLATPGTETSCSATATNGNCAAEEFDYSPSVWLTYPNQNTSPDVQAITSFPPIL